MNTGEDIQSLRKITDFTRLLSIFILALHFYLSCYQAFSSFGWTAGITDKIIGHIARTGLFSSLMAPKLAALLLLAVSLIAVKGKKDEKVALRTALAYFITGLLLYFISVLCFYLPSGPTQVALAYLAITSTGYILIITGGGLLSRIIRDSLSPDIFNTDNETFPQEERLLENEYSINLPALYNLKGKIRKSYISIINPFRGLLVSGTPGSR
jgi:hypothetical protein